MHRRRGRQPDPSGVRRAGLTASAAARMHERARPRNAAGGLIRARPGRRRAHGTAGFRAGAPAGDWPARRQRRGRRQGSCRCDGRDACRFRCDRKVVPQDPGGGLDHAGTRAKCAMAGPARPAMGASGRHVCGVPSACTYGETQAAAGRRADTAAVALGLAALGKGGRRDQRRSLLLRGSGPLHPCARTEKQPEDSTTEAIRQTACPRSRRQRRPRATRPARTRAPLRRAFRRGARPAPGQGKARCTSTAAQARVTATATTTTTTTAEKATALASPLRVCVSLPAPCAATPKRGRLSARP